jgi:hypothetical protein
MQPVRYELEFYMLFRTGSNWATLFLEDIYTMDLPFRLGESRIRDIKNGHESRRTLT